jgi:hypothetical protein
MKILIEHKDFIVSLDEVMSDSEVDKFFEKATERKYTNKETCINDIRRLLMLFWNEKLRSI